MLVESHFDIEARELTEMAICVRVFSAENWPNLKDSLHVSTQNHLLVKLRALSKASFLTEVVKSENVGSTL
jgi:hypothetical protein